VGARAGPDILEMRKISGVLLGSKTQIIQPTATVLNFEEESA